MEWPDSSSMPGIASPFVMQVDGIVRTLGTLVPNLGNSGATNAKPPGLLRRVLASS